jgi:hypothetical protein
VRSKEFVSLPVPSGECSPRCSFYRCPGYLVPTCQLSVFSNFRIIFCFLAACFCLFSDLGRFHFSCPCLFQRVFTCFLTWANSTSKITPLNACPCLSVLVSACFLTWAKIFIGPTQPSLFPRVSACFACFRLLPLVSA